MLTLKLSKNQWFAIFVAFLILVLSGSVIQFGTWKNEPAEVGQREPLSALGYCSANQVKPCVLSFHVDSDGDMLIHILTDLSWPDFYLKIKNSETENSYECQLTKGFSNAVTCVGDIMPLGQNFQFSLISAQEHTLIAVGRFPIIGLALATPEIYLTPTPKPPLKRY